MLEGLAILVALRSWESELDARRFKLCVRGDNIGALVLLTKMRPKTPNAAISARELALVTVLSAFPPEAQHTPGVAHVVADGLSRLHDPRADHSVLEHPALRCAVRTTVPERTASYYRALPKQNPLTEQVGSNGGPASISACV